MACDGGLSSPPIVGVLNAAVAAAYYLRIVAVMYFRTPLATPRAQGGAGAWWAAVACALLLVGVGVYPGPLDASGGTGKQWADGSFLCETASGCLPIIDYQRKAATPVCPVTWSGGDEKAFVDSRLLQPHLRCYYQGW